MGAVDVLMTAANESALIAEAVRLKTEGLGLQRVADRIGKTKGYVRHLLMRERLKSVPAASTAPPSAVEIDPQTPIKFHPFAALFPLIEGAEFDDLVADIKANGQREDIVLLDGDVLDGRNRFRACLAAGVAPRIVPFRREFDGDPLAFVISKNLKRRHLDESQRAMVAAAIANLDHGQRADRAANLPVLPVRQAEAAKMLSISERALRAARSVRDHGEPELVRAVERGRLAVSAASHAARLAPDMQRKVAAAAEAGEANAARTAIKRAAREVRERDLGGKIASGNLELPQQRFGVILADPAWGRTVYNADTGMDRHAANHYPTAKGDESTQDDAIKALPVASIAADDCVLGLWCTDPHRGVDVLRAWDFVPKTYFVWIKDVLPLDGGDGSRTMLGAGTRFEVVGAAGTGYWRRDRCEMLLIGVRGHPVCPAPGTQGESVWFARRGEHATRREDSHSDKPERSFQWFERHWPTIPKAELNARRARAGWVTWGFDAPVPGCDHETEKSPADCLQQWPGKIVQSNGEIHQDAGEAQAPAC
jgi:N6-adenosine-specific RNA methylase IME4